MVPLQALFTVILRQAGKLLNTVFGWATSMLFGQVPEKRQLYLSIIGLGSVLWIVVVVGIGLPRVAAFLLTFVPLPAWLAPHVRWVMLGLAVLVPPLVGFVSLFLVDPAERPRGADRVKAILKGYPYTLGLACTLLMMIVVAPVLKARDLLRGWTASHVPVVVQSEDYFDVVQDVERVLRAGGFEATRHRASALLRWPTRVFTFFAGGNVDDLVAEELTVLRLPAGEVMLHPSDLVLRGKEKDVVRVQALLTEQLTFGKAYMTWSKEAHALEDRLARLWRRVKDAPQDVHPEEALAELGEAERALRGLAVSFEEWEVLFREKLVVERAVLRAAAGLAGTPREASDAGRAARVTPSP